MKPSSPANYSTPRTDSSVIHLVSRWGLRLGVAAAAVFAPLAASAGESVPEHLMNRWKQDRYLYIDEGGSALANQIAFTWWSAQWYFKPLADQVRLDDPCGSMFLAAELCQGFQDAVNGLSGEALGNAYLIYNRWKPDQLLALDSEGQLKVSPKDQLTTLPVWVAEDVGDNFFRLYHWDTRKYLVLDESGRAGVSSNTPEGYWSSHWRKYAAAAEAQPQEPSPQLMPGQARDLAVGANGAVWAIGTDAQPGGYGIYRWNGSDWSRVLGAAEAIAVDPEGNAWVVNSSSKIYRYQSGQWVPVPGSARDIAIGANGAVWAIGTDAQPGGFGIYRWDGSGWLPFHDPEVGGSAIAVDPNGNPWVTTNGGRIYRFEMPRWQLQPGYAKEIAIGPEGKIWKVGPNTVGQGFKVGFEVHYWENGWVAVPGSLVTIAAGPGKLYGIGPDYEILQMP